MLLCAAGLWGTPVSVRPFCLCRFASLSYLTGIVVLICWDSGEFVSPDATLEAE